MKTANYFLLLFISVILSSCAMDYYYTYQPDASKLGKAVIIPTTATNKTYVLLNDSLIIKNKYLKSLTLENLPDGDYQLVYMCNNSNYKEKIDKAVFFTIENGTKKVELVGVPPMSTGYWMYNGLITSALYGILFFPAVISN